MSAASATSPAATPAGRTDSRWIGVFGKLLRTEGTSFTQSAADKGGATRYGLSLRFLANTRALSPQLMAELDIDHDGDLEVTDVAGMSEAAAEDVYYALFWAPVSALAQPYDAAVFDQSVNDGLVPAVKMLQAAVNSLAPHFPIAVDGVLGPATREAAGLAVMNHGAAAAIAAYRAQAAARYRLIVQHDPSQAKWLSGWLNRAKELGDV